MLKIFTSYLKLLGVYELFRYNATHHEGALLEKMSSCKHKLTYNPEVVFSNVASSFIWSNTKETDTWVIVSRFWELLLSIRNKKELSEIESRIKLVRNDVYVYSKSNSMIPSVLEIIKTETFKIAKSLNVNPHKK